MFSPPAEGNKDVQQLQEDLQQEKKDNTVEPEEKKKLCKLSLPITTQIRHQSQRKWIWLVLSGCAAAHQIPEIHQCRLSAQQQNWHCDCGGYALTGFDSQVFEYLVCGQNLKYHGLIQACSRTNRVRTTPNLRQYSWFPAKQAEVAAIALFSGEDTGRAKKFWLVDAAFKVMEKKNGGNGNVYAEAAICPAHRKKFNLKGDAALREFINVFKEVQRLKTQLDQYTDLTDEQQATIENLARRAIALLSEFVFETAKRLKDIQRKEGVKCSHDAATWFWICACFCCGGLWLHHGTHCQVHPKQTLQTNNDPRTVDWSAWFRVRIWWTNARTSLTTLMRWKLAKA